MPNSPGVPPAEGCSDVVDVMTTGLNVLRSPSSPVALAFWCLVTLAAFLWFMRHVMPVLERLVR